MAEAYSMYAFNFLIKYVVYIITFPAMYDSMTQLYMSSILENSWHGQTFKFSPFQ